MPETPPPVPPEERVEPSSTGESIENAGETPQGTPRDFVVNDAEAANPAQAEANEEALQRVRGNLDLPQKPTKEQILERYLSYQDGNFTDEQKQRMLEANSRNPSAGIYAESLVEAADTEGIEAIESKAQELKAKVLDEAMRLGIPVSEAGRSIAWAMWDIGKQYHFFKNPEQNDPKYTIGNPLESEEKQGEIVNRHLGWEAFAAYKNFPPYKKMIEENPAFAAAHEHFNKEPKENGSLSSAELALLGEALRGVEGTFTAQETTTRAENGEGPSTQGEEGAEGVQNQEGGQEGDQNIENPTERKTIDKAKEAWQKVKGLEYDGKKKKWKDKTPKERAFSVAAGVGRGAAGIAAASVASWGVIEAAKLAGFGPSIGIGATYAGFGAVGGFLGMLGSAAVIDIFGMRALNAFYQAWKEHGSSTIKEILGVDIGLGGGGGKKGGGDHKPAAASGGGAAHH
jgi:hypothetical protein